MKEVSKLESSLKRKFSAASGAFYSSLEGSLKALYVQRQAYQGGTFIGNHVHKLLKLHVNYIYYCYLISYNPV